VHKYYSPRWQHAHLSLGAEQTVMLNPGDFTNEEPWDWHLCWLSIAGTPLVVAGGDWSTLQGGVTRRLSIQVGMSQTGPINVVNSNGQGMFGPVRDIMVAGDGRDVGAQFNFPKAYRLPRDAGFDIDVQNDSGTVLQFTAAGFSGFELPYGPKGIRRPVYFGSNLDAPLADGAAAVMAGADLQNDGDNTAYITQMILGSAAGDNNGDPNLVGTSWRVNPTSGIFWMDPARAPIPAGCIAPFNQSSDDFLDEGPRAYRFPKGTILNPHRQLQISITELSVAAQEVDVCLFGLVEVS